MAKKTFSLTETEWTVIKCVWQGEPCTAPGVHLKLHSSTGWAYSTVRTIMDRMVAKGLLSAEKAGKLTMFRSAITRRQAQRSELLYALKNAFNGALTPMVQCLLDTGSLSADEIADLESMLKTKKRGAKQKPSASPE